MNKLIFIAILFFSVTSQAGNISNIIIDNNDKLIIYHQDCDLKPPIISSRKLILPLENCASSAGKIPRSSGNLKQVHWAQHNPTTVWIVVTFLTDYQFEMVPSPDKYIICLATSCKPKPSSAELKNLTPSQTLMFSLENILFKIPLKNMLIAEFLDRSIGFVPRDLIRDGLPHFGAKRDDWKRKTRKHLGYDIYTDKMDVIAAAPGVVSRVGKSYQAGLYIKLNHDNNLTTVYVHLNQSLVKKGQLVKQSEVIGRIDGAAGNAISPQLHFEIKIKDKSIDPLPLIEKFYQADNPIKAKIKVYKQKLIKLSQYRDNLVKQYLLKH
jgi:hypothetical protein